MRYLGAAALLVLFVLAWQGVATLHSVDDLTLASPVETARRPGTTTGRSSMDNVGRHAGGGAARPRGLDAWLGVTCAVAMHLFRPLRDAAYPLLVASQAIPVVVLAPLCSCSRSITGSGWSWRSSR